MNSELRCEARSRERRRLILFFGASSLVFLALELATSSPSPVAIAGRVFLSVILLAEGLLLGRVRDDRLARLTVRACAFLGVASLGALVWGTGGTTGPYFLFFSVLPIVFTVIVPDDLVATGIVGGVATALGIACCVLEHGRGERLAFVIAAFSSSTAYALAGTYLHRRMRLREARREARRARAREALASRNRQRDRIALEREVLSKQLQLVQRHVNDALLLIREDGTILEANDRALAMYGYTEAELLALDVRALLSGEEGRSAVDAAVRAAIAENGLRVKTVHARKDGTIFPAEVSGRPLELRGERRLLVIVRDLSEEQAARAAVERQAALLQQGEERLRRIVETSVEGILVVDAQGRTEFANARAAELVGVAGVDLVGRHFVDLFPPELRDGARADLARLVAGERLSREVQFRRADGAVLWLSGAATPLRDPEGRTTGAAMAFMDVTAHRRAQEQLLQVQKMEAVGRLASGIAHDFNNLLVVILSNARALRTDGPSPEQRELAQEIVDAGDRAAQLVRQLLAFGRRNAVRPVAVDLGRVVAELEPLIRRTIGDHIVVTVTVERDLWPTRIDPSNLEQIILNLAVNARDAMPHGGELRVSATRAVVERFRPEREDAPPPGRYVVLTVSDTGTGMPPHVLSRIFEPFFTTKEPGKGTGLGLATTFGIVEQARGKVSVVSTPGAGTTFTIHLPACDASAVSAVPPSRSAEAPVRVNGRARA